MTHTDSQTHTPSSFLQPSYWSSHTWLSQEKAGVCACLSVSILWHECLSKHVWFNVLYAHSVIGVCMCECVFYLHLTSHLCEMSANVLLRCEWVCLYSILPVCSASLAACCVCMCVLGWSYKCRGSKLVYTGEGVRERERNSEKARKTESGGSLGVNGATWLWSVVGQPVVLFPSLSSPLCLSLPFLLFLPLPALHLPTPPRHCAAVKTFNRWWMSQPTPSLPPLPFPSLLEN